MGVSSATTQAGVARDHGFHELRVARVVRETADAASFVLDVPADLRDAYAYDAGQFCTFRVAVDGAEHLRCYSMSSSPHVDADLQVTVKRVAGGVVSNWMIDSLAPGDAIDATRPAGVFRLGDRDSGGTVVGFAAGSGITPIFSIAKTVLATTSRPVRLLYANRDADSVIFAGALRDLVARFGGRLEVLHHLDVDAGFVDATTIERFLGGTSPGECFVCGPGPFMDVVEGSLLGAGVAEERIRIERFVAAAPVEPAEVAAAEAAAGATTVTIELDGRRAGVEHRPGTTILQTARQLGLSPPFSCESGSCATCMAKLVRGTASMFVNNALTDDEVAEGWVLTCQAVPTSPDVHVAYGFA